MTTKCCIRDGCGKPFDSSVPEKRGYLRAFWQRYCPEHRLDPNPQAPITEVRAVSPIEDILESAQNWISEDADNPNPMPEEWAQAKHLLLAAPELLQALRELQKELRHAVKLDVKKHYSLMVADACASKAIAKAEGKD